MKKNIYAIHFMDFVHYYIILSISVQSNSQEMFMMSADREYVLETFFVFSYTRMITRFSRAISGNTIG